MNVASINTADSNLSSLMAQGAKAAGKGNEPITAAERAKVAATFGSLLMREMLDPVIEPMLKGLQGSSSSGGGGGMYSHLIKDALVSSLSQNGAGGLSAGFEHHFSPPSSAALKPASQPS
ncbi:MAG: hypothetical protein WCG63_02415 [Opitutaceae bacterium]|jgi:hypothetical protein